MAPVIEILPANNTATYSLLPGDGFTQQVVSDSQGCADWQIVTGPIMVNYIADKRNTPSEAHCEGLVRLAGLQEVCLRLQVSMVGLLEYS